jgi:ElaB/YqjD/DUF883 family membrane-anchored ribosome-binding protein
MASRNTSTDRPLSDKAAGFSQDVADRANEARDALSDMARTATKKVEDAVDDLPSGQRVKEFASAAADRLSTTADYMRTHDAKRMMADVETVVKNNPGPALLVAAVCGFMLGRAITRD